MSKKQEIQQANIQLFHPTRLFSASTPSPFALKLMTYFRMADLHYSVIESPQNSSKGKTPFILFNGKEIPDSTFIINFLNKEFNVDLNSSLTESEKATSLAFQRLCEENLYWVLVYYRWRVKNDEFFNQIPARGLKRIGVKISAKFQVKPALNANLHGQGMGRHSREEVDSIAERDMGALSSYLEGKQFFMGDKPTDVDCSVFGLLAQFAYVKIGAKPETLLQENFPNLLAYCNRMKKSYWPDWDEKCAKQK